MDSQFVSTGHTYTPPVEDTGTRPPSAHTMHAKTTTTAAAAARQAAPGAVRRPAASGPATTARRGAPGSAAEGAPVAAAARRPVVGGVAPAGVRRGRAAVRFAAAVGTGKRGAARVPVPVAVVVRGSGPVPQGVPARARAGATKAGAGAARAGGATRGARVGAKPTMVRQGATRRAVAAATAAAAVEDVERCGECGAALDLAADCVVASGEGLVHMRCRVTRSPTPACASADDVMPPASPTHVAAGECGGWGRGRSPSPAPAPAAFAPTPTRVTPAVGEVLPRRSCTPMPAVLRVAPHGSATPARDRSPSAAPEPQAVAPTPTAVALPARRSCTPTPAELRVAPHAAGGDAAARPTWDVPCATEKAVAKQQRQAKVNAVEAYKLREMDPARQASLAEVEGELAVLLDMAALL